MLALVLVLVGLLLGYAVGLVVHELGHALVALRRPGRIVTVSVGRAPALKLRLGRLQVALGARDLRHGETRYADDGTGAVDRCLVALGGPSATTAMAAALGAALCWGSIGGALWLCALGALVANLRILVTALWPFTFRPETAPGEAWSSDGVVAWRAIAACRSRGRGW